MRANNAPVVREFAGNYDPLTTICEGTIDEWTTQRPAARDSGDGMAIQLWMSSSIAADRVYRDVSFTISEGTWMNLDVGPNGKTIAFDLLNDIYVMPSEGGVATVIHSGPESMNESGNYNRPRTQFYWELGNRNGIECNAAWSAGEH
jgi:hypothetical protein